MIHFYFKHVIFCSVLISFSISNVYSQLKYQATVCTIERCIDSLKIVNKQEVSDAGNVDQLIDKIYNCIKPKEGNLNTIVIQIEENLSFKEFEDLLNNNNISRIYYKIIKLKQIDEKDNRLVPVGKGSPERDRYELIKIDPSQLRKGEDYKVSLKKGKYIDYSIHFKITSLDKDRKVIECEESIIRLIPSSTGSTQFILEFVNIDDNKLNELIGKNLSKKHHVLKWYSQYSSLQDIENKIKLNKEYIMNSPMTQAPLDYSHNNIIQNLKYVIRIKVL